jgi:hypothetical protein
MKHPLTQLATLAALSPKGARAKIPAANPRPARGRGEEVVELAPSVAAATNEPAQRVPRTRDRSASCSRHATGIVDREGHMISPLTRLRWRAKLLGYRLCSRRRGPSHTAGPSDGRKPGAPDRSHRDKFRRGLDCVEGSCNRRTSKTRHQCPESEVRVRIRRHSSGRSEAPKGRHSLAHGVSHGIEVHSPFRPPSPAGAGGGEGVRVGLVDPSRVRGTVGYSMSPAVRARPINELLERDARCQKPECRALYSGF